jgi:membrane-associated phospholipid phosphatase
MLSTLQKNISTFLKKLSLFQTLTAAIMSIAITYSTSALANQNNETTKPTSPQTNSNPNTEPLEKKSVAPTETLSFSDYHVRPFLKKAFDQHSLTTLFSATAAVVYANYYDIETQQNWMQHQQMSKDLAKVGDITGSGLVGLGIFALQYKFDENVTHWMSHGRALVWGTIASSTLKVAFGRQRPSNNPNYHSFPSGHTTTAFTTATALSYAYGWKAAVIAYPIATFVGLSRLSDNVHWGSDVVGGAFLGYWAARASFYSKEEASLLSKSQQTQYQWVPLVSGDFVGANFNWQF